MPSSPKPVASVILAVYNAESTIHSCLNSLLTQSTPTEIIIVDDGSTDHTNSSMVRTIELYPQAKIVMLKQKHGGPALARNLGSKHAHTQILLFVDADMTFARDYVKDLIAPILAKQAIGTFTREELVANWDNIWARCWNIQEGWEARKRFPKDPPAYGTDYRAILKSEFERVGGFDNTGYTDTWSLFSKLGVRPLGTKAICYHKNPDTLGAVYRQARWSAKRSYKFGSLGIIFGLLRTTLPVSLVVGTAKAIWHLTPAFLLFKIIYDLGRLVGITQMVLTGKLSK